jgi:hypothetical protein
MRSQRWGRQVKRRWPMGNMSIGRNSLHTLQNRTPLRSGTLVGFERTFMTLEFISSGVSACCDASIPESELSSFATKWVYREVCLVTQHIVEFAGVLYPHREVLQKQTSIRSFKYAELANILLPQTTSGGDFTGSTFGF